jgi:hypothetical protein
LLHSAAEAVTPERDAKLKELKQLIEHKVREATTNKRGEEARRLKYHAANQF